MKSKIMTLLVSSIILISLSSQGVHAAEPASSVKPINSSISQLSTGGDYYTWRIKNTSSAYTTYGSWVWGTQSSSPSPTDNNSLSFSITNSVSVEVQGTIEVAKSDLTASTGYTIGQSWSATAGYTMGLSKGQMGRIEYRNIYDTKDVTQAEYLKDGTITEATGNIEVVTVKKFKAYDYRAYLI